jgi:hypothetical protein
MPAADSVVLHFAIPPPASAHQMPEFGISINGNTAELSGPALLEDGSKVTFTVSVTDNGEPGTSDTISISLSDGYFVSGILISGDIRIY